VYKRQAARIGGSFPAVIVSAFPGGLSIQLLETGMDGVLPMRELRDDFYSFDPKRLCLVGKRSARTIGCGAELDVIVNSVDIERADVVFGLESKGSFAQAIRPPKPVSRNLDKTKSAEPVPAHVPAAAALVRKPLPSSVVRSAPPTAVSKAPAATPKPPVSEEPAVAEAPAKRGATTRRVAKAAPPVEVEEQEALDIEPHETPTAVIRRKRLPIDPGIDRSRVPERWRVGSTSARPDRSDYAEPVVQEKKKGKAPKSKKKHQW
jgi:hypothetical protein